MEATFSEEIQGEKHSRGTGGKIRSEGNCVLPVWQGGRVVGLLRETEKCGDLGVYRIKGIYGSNEGTREGLSGVKF